MTDEIHFGAHSASETFDSFDSIHASPPFDRPADADDAARGPRRDSGARRSADEVPEPVDPELSDTAPVEAPSADSALEPAADDAGQKRRRRGSRGGRRRRGRREGEPAETVATEGDAEAGSAAVEPPLPGEDDAFDSPEGADVESENPDDGAAQSAEESAPGAADAPRRRSRRGRGGRGRGAAAVESRGPTAEESRGAAAVEQRGAAAVEQRGAAAVGKRGAAAVEKRGAAAVEKRGAAAVEKRGAAAVEKRGAAAVEKRGAAAVEKRGAAAVEKTEPARDVATPARRASPARAPVTRGALPVGTPRRSPSRGSVPREIDALDDDADLALDAVPADDGVPLAREGEVGTALDDGKRRRRGNRGGRRRKTHAATGARIESHPSSASSSRPNSSRSNSSRSAASRSTAARHEKAVAVEIESIPGEDDDLPLVEHAVAAPLAPESDARGTRRRRGRGREADVADPESDPDAPRVVPESERRSMILVNATDPEEQRVAVLEDGKITDFLMTVKDQDTLVNDIYRGRVVNLEPAIGAAFIDFGQGRNGFLHTSDVLTAYGEDDFDLDKLLSTQIDPEEWDENSGQPAVSAEIDDADDDEERPSKRGAKGKDAKGGRGKRRFEARPRLPITDLLEKGQTVVVQVTKDAIGDKGPTLTTYISIPGRYLVLMPSMSRTGVSRKIEDEKERRRLKRILQTLEVPKGMGVIVRTAGVGHSKNEIKRDLDYLISLWTAFGKKLHQGHGPAALYRESDVAIKTMRDLFSSNTKAVLVDDPEVQRQILEFTEKLMPEDVGRVQLHDGAKPLFQHYNVEPDFERIFQRRIELASGGSIVFDQAEALVAIDVNSGRTRSDGFDFEDIALKTNLEAAPEIARQMRLRDLGGIIVVDFIDMMKMSNIRLVEKAFKEALEGDRARSKVGRISQFGLLEMTRQRLGPGMDKKVFHHCPRCRGTGRIRTVNSRAAAILRRLSSALTHKGFQTVEVRAHPEVVAYLKSDCSDHMRALEYRFQKDVKLFDAPEQSEDSVLRYVRPDGREVRPGGRRKR